MNASNPTRVPPRVASLPDIRLVSGSRSVLSTSLPAFDKYSPQDLSNMRYMSQSLSNLSLEDLHKSDSDVFSHNAPVKRTLSNGGNSWTSKKRDNGFSGSQPFPPQKRSTVDIEKEINGQNLYKTELCRSFVETGVCRYGAKCQFAHGRPELRPVLRHPKYKTEICKTFHTIGTCPYGTRCRFIHKKPETEGDNSVFLPPQTVKTRMVNRPRSKSCISPKPKHQHSPKIPPLIEKINPHPPHPIVSEGRQRSNSLTINGAYHQGRKLSNGRLKSPKYLSPRHGDHILGTSYSPKHQRLDYELAMSNSWPPPTEVDLGYDMIGGLGGRSRIELPGLGPVDELDDELMVSGFIPDMMNEPPEERGVASPIASPLGRNRTSSSCSRLPIFQSLSESLTLDDRDLLSTST
eukprot:CAMPEP_0174264646 /NCGR_PEP_ID=MMETSP0439-20130205/23267_1 /TAXON_ID=0 /ORGANISM="Stereomyxa ramosa, Strain Chinc5" /LENGTH=405 /DNA_ID=CAMNT_0015350635 /DNA_START=106 /DNA_END=1323 /DNA_ORIENTATION=+